MARQLVQLLANNLVFTNINHVCQNSMEFTLSNNTHSYTPRAVLESTTFQAAGKYSSRPAASVGRGRNKHFTIPYINIYTHMQHIHISQNTISELRVSTHFLAHHNTDQTSTNNLQTSLLENFMGQSRPVTITKLSILRLPKQYIMFCSHGSYNFCSQLYPITVQLWIQLATLTLYLVNMHSHHRWS